MNGICDTHCTRGAIRIMVQGPSPLLPLSTVDVVIYDNNYLFFFSDPAAIKSISKDVLVSPGDEGKISCTVTGELCNVQCASSKSVTERVIHKT